MTEINQSELSDYLGTLYELICLRIERGSHTKEEVTVFIKKVTEYLENETGDK